MRMSRRDARCRDLLQIGFQLLVHNKQDLDCRARVTVAFGDNIVDLRFYRMVHFISFWSAFAPTHYQSGLRPNYNYARQLWNETQLFDEVGNPRYRP